MKLPEQEWFTVGELARRWNVEESYVDQMIESHRLKAEFKDGVSLLSKLQSLSS